MTPEFLRAVLDTLAPGETVSGEAGLPPLPSGSAAGVDIAAHAAVHDDVLHAIAARASGAEAFATADEAERVSLLQVTERERPDAFRALVVDLLTDYYETDIVLTAMGWRTEPPQPMGHAMTSMATPTKTALNHVREKIKLWRE